MRRGGAWYCSAMQREEFLSGWGRYPVRAAQLRESPDLAAITADANLSRGLGRAYGDAAVAARSDDVVAGTRSATRVLDLDTHAGVLRVEAGISLEALHDLLWPLGWSCPVLPGTQYVTAGGMVAADVHGKNHHVSGSFGHHVRALRVRTAAGDILDIDREREPDLFRATIGGMGLTCHILEVEVQLERIESSWIAQETECVGGLDELLVRLAAAGDKWPMTVTWADGLAGGEAIGRGVVIKGRWADASDLPSREWRRGPRVTMPVMMPGWTPRSALVRLLNVAYYHRHRATAGRSVVPPLPFFHPLDVVRSWNRFYGRRGFTQYQCVLPGRDVSEAAHGVFDILRRRNAPSLLTVIKDFGVAGEGLLSFPMPGVTLSLDLPIRMPDTARVVSMLNALVAEAGGRIYLAKDALTSADDFRRMEGERLDRFNAVRDRWDPERRLRSGLSVRLLGDPE
ncbi:MAG: FAD-binding protein [Acidobacteria bacterium]|nr:FAD-binding protein [Acidobacteriota bacterium]